MDDKEVEELPAMPLFEQIQRAFVGGDEIDEARRARRAIIEQTIIDKRRANRQHLLNEAMAIIFAVFLVFMMAMGAWWVWGLVS